MSDVELVELVIKIPEEEYRMILSSDKTAIANCVSKESMMYAIKKGTLLPKGHGRLVDADILENEMIINRIKAGNYEKGYEHYDHINNMDDCIECVKYADTIIEADKEDK